MIAGLKRRKAFVDAAATYNGWMRERVSGIISLTSSVTTLVC